MGPLWYLIPDLTCRPAFRVIETSSSILKFAAAGVTRTKTVAAAGPSESAGLVTGATQISWI
jgi:hypothetical protein